MTCDVVESTLALWLGTPLAKRCLIGEDSVNKSHRVTETLRTPLNVKVTKVVSWGAVGGYGEHIIVKTPNGPRTYVVDSRGFLGLFTPLNEH